MRPAVLGILWLLLAGCAVTREVSVESWQCRNDLEVSCGKGKCEAASGEGFTPMSVSADSSGAMSVCAYSGCWEGTGEVLASERFLVLVGVGLEFSTSRDAESTADIVIAIDRADRVATLKAEEFAHPLLCESLGANVRDKDSDPIARPLPSVEAPSEDTLWLAAPVGTRVDLRVMSGERRRGEIVGSVVGQHGDIDTDTFHDYFEPRTPPGHIEAVAELLVDGKLVDDVFEVPWEEESLQLVGEVVTPAGERISVDLELPVHIIWGAGIVITPGGDVALELKYFPACPWVYVRRGEGWEPAVEILQNLRRRDQERAQRVSLGPVTPVSDGEIVLQLREQLPEISFLDHLELELPGLPRSIPLAAASRGLSSLASADGDYLVLREGDVVEVVFRDERLHRGRTVVPAIVATGYYEFLVPSHP